MELLTFIQPKAHIGSSLQMNTIWILTDAQHQY